MAYSIFTKGIETIPLFFKIIRRNGSSNEPTKTCFVVSVVLTLNKDELLQRRKAHYGFKSKELDLDGLKLEFKN